MPEFDPPPLLMIKSMYYVYVLESERDHSIYVGYTNDLKRRFEDHNKGLCGSTKNKTPHRIVAYEAYSSERDARIRERRLKQFKNAYKELIKRISFSLAQ